MLAVAQGLVRRPRLLMLDEPSAGLSPVLVDRVLAVARQLCENGTAVLLVEQLIEKALALADRVYALARGSIVHGGPDRRGRPAGPAGGRVFRPGGQSAAVVISGRPGLAIRGYVRSRDWPGPNTLRIRTSPAVSLRPVSGVTRYRAR